MSASTEYSEYALELLESVGPLRTGRFFGGIGIYCESVQFAMIMGNSLYFVVGEDTREKYKQMGMQPFSYMTKRGRIQVRRYFEVPEEVLTNPEQLQRWANESIQIAGRTQPYKKLNQARQKWRND